MNFLVFDTQADAQVNEGIICVNIGCDITGRNAHTGELEPDKQKTTCWAEPVQRLDGKWVFQAPEMKYMAGVSDHTVEAYDSAWFPQEETP
jgi:hypothetical protein